MDETELIETLVSHFDTTLSVEVAAKGLEDDRPVPAAIIDDWSTEDLNLHNSAYAGEARGDFDNDGTDEYERYLNFDWQTRVEFSVVAHDEVESSRLSSTIVSEFRYLSEYPQNLHEDIKSVSVLPSGDPQSVFVEPKETELNVSVRIGGDDTLVVGPDEVGADPIELITDTFKASGDTLPLSD